MNFFFLKGFDLFQRVKCRFYECCSAPYLRNNFTMLEENLSHSLFGQPFVKNTVVNALRGHFHLNGPKKALVLSFHGSTGVGTFTFYFCILWWTIEINLITSFFFFIGKNFVVQFIANSLFARGVRSKFFKLFIASRDFPHNEKIDEYRVCFCFWNFLDFSFKIIEI